MEKNNILVLGGGIGGLVASNILADRLKNKAAITLIERKDKFQFPPSYPWLMLGTRRPEQVQRDLTILKKKDIKVVKDEVISINIGDKSVGTKTGKFKYDYLVIALGAEYAPNTIPGFSEHAQHIYDLDSATRFKKSVEKFEGGTIAIGVSRTPFKCPAAPFEVALLLEYYYAKKGIRNNMKIEFFTPETIPVPAVGPEIGNKVLDLLKSRGINYHPKLRLKDVKKNQLSFENGETMSFDLLFCVPPHVAPQPAVKAGLTSKENGWIPVNPRTLMTDFEGVYAIGDITSVPTPSGYMPFLPKAGVFAHGHAEVVANNIAVKVSGKGKIKEWDGNGLCFLEVGGGLSAFLKGDFLSEPRPSIRFHTPNRIWHAQKVLFEKYWMKHWF